MHCNSDNANRKDRISKQKKNKFKLITENKNFGSTSVKLLWNAVVLLLVETNDDHKSCAAFRGREKTSLLYYL